MTPHSLYLTANIARLQGTRKALGRLPLSGTVQLPLRPGVTPNFDSFYVCELLALLDCAIESQTRELAGVGI